MQIKKLLAAGALATLMAGSTLAFAEDISNYPSPFVTSAGVASFVVIGADAQPSDVVGAIDMATRLGGEVTTTKTIAGTSATMSVSGEGKAIATANTKQYLNDSLRKTGARTTLTAQDMSVILKAGELTDTDASTSYKYKQYIDFGVNYTVQFAQYRLLDSYD